MNRVHFASTGSDRETPPEIFEPLNREFHFTFDVCANAKNAKCRKWNGISHLRRWTGRCWMNPPYGQEIRSWIHAASKLDGMIELVCCLLPARTDTRWWHDYIWDATMHQPRRNVEVRFLKGRITFWKDGKPMAHPAPFPSCIVIFRRPK